MTFGERAFSPSAFQKKRTVEMKKYRIGSTWISYDSSGADRGLPLVFLHGASVDHVSMKNTFEPYFRRLARKYRRVYIDLPGHGESGHSLFRATLPALLKDVEAFLRGNFKKPPSLVGYSMGGFVALKLAEKMRFPSLFLVAPPVYSNKYKVSKPEKVELHCDELTVAERKGADARYLLLAAKRTPETLRKYRANTVPGFSPGRFAYRTLLFANANSLSLTIKPRLIRSRTVILAGRQDILVGYRDQFELASRLKFGEYHSFNDCGHYLPNECGQFRALFLNWLKERVEGLG